MTRFIRTYLIFQLTVLFAFCNLYAQDRTCGSTLDQWNKLIQTERYKEVHKQILQLRQNNAVTSFCDTDSFFTVPVVVHIVYNVRSVLVYSIGQALIRKYDTVPVNYKLQTVLLEE